MVIIETVLPKEADIEKTGRGGVALLHYAFNYDHWEFRQETGADKGRDCAFEYVDEENSWHNGIIRGQVKGTKTPDSYRLKTKDCFSYNLDRKTINYALRSNDAFLLFLCDLVNEKVYYLPIQDYFIENESEYDTLEKKNDGGMMVHIPTANIVTRDDDSALVDLAQSSYCFREGRVCKVRTDK